MLMYVNKAVHMKHELHDIYLLTYLLTYHQ